MATYDVTGPGGTNRPGRYNPGIRTPYLVENTIDISAINGDSGAAQNDVLRVIDLPAETLVMEAGIEVLTALSSSVTMDLGITGGAADTLDVLVLSAASTAGKIRVWAILCDVAGVDENDRQSDAQHDTAQ